MNQKQRVIKGFSITYLNCKQRKRTAVCANRVVERKQQFLNIARTFVKEYLVKSGICNGLNKLGTLVIALEI